MNWLYASADLAFKAAYFVWSNRMAVIRCFWPVMALVLVMELMLVARLVLRSGALAGHSSHGLGSFIFLVGGVILLIYSVVTGASCAIRWHRFVQLGEELGWATLRLSTGTSRYFWQTLLFGLMVIIVVLAGLLIIGGLSAAVPHDVITDRVFVSLFALAILGGSLVLLLCYAKWFLAFPHIAVDAENFAPLCVRMAYPWRWVIATIIGSFLWVLTVEVLKFGLLDWVGTVSVVSAVGLLCGGIFIAQYFAAWQVTAMSMEYRSQLQRLGKV